MPRSIDPLLRPLDPCTPARAPPCTRCVGSTMPPREQRSGAANRATSADAKRKAEATRKKAQRAAKKKASAASGDLVAAGVQMTVAHAGCCMLHVG
jgi:hypothetical protein